MSHRVILSSEVVDQIIFAMENQEESFLFHMEKLEVVPVAGFETEDGGESLPEKLVSIPRWSSADGFRLMEKFVSSLNNPMYREELSRALAGGKGVFRRFKDVLKNHGPLEKLWYSFKEHEMRQTVRDWFHRNEEARDLASLGPEPEETGELVLSDFPLEIHPLPEPVEEELVEYCFQGLFPESEELLFRSFVEECMLVLENGDEVVMVSAAAPDGGRAGFALMAGFNAEEGFVFRLPLLFVDPRFRGLGLAKLLIEQAREEAAARAAAGLLLDIPGNGAVLLPFLEEAGFSTVRRSCFVNLRLQ